MQVATIHLRISFYVTEPEAQSGLFNRRSFYKTPLVMRGNAVLVDESLEVLCRLFSQTIPEKLTAQLETSAQKHKHLILDKCYKTDDVRGPHVTVRFGCYIKRGGSGSIRVSENNEILKEFLEENKTLWIFVSVLLCLFDPELAEIIQKIPLFYRIFGLFSIGFWNVTNISKLHRDLKDLRWCAAIPFGEFEGGMLDLKFLNTTVHVKRGDICFKSKDLFHNLSEVFGNRQVMILTNHAAVVS